MLEDEFGFDPFSCHRYSSDCTTPTAKFTTPSRNGDVIRHSQLGAWRVRGSGGYRRGLRIVVPTGEAFAKARCARGDKSFRNARMTSRSTPEAGMPPTFLEGLSASTKAGCSRASRVGSGASLAGRAATVRHFSRAGSKPTRCISGSALQDRETPSASPVGSGSRPTRSLEDHQVDP